MMTAPVIQKLDSVTQRELLLRDIPHRICASITWQKMEGNWKMPSDPEWKDKDKDRFHIWCVGRSVDEGRKAAMRWLIEFVGVARNKKEKPCIPNYKPKDIWIEHINSGKLFDSTDPNAQKLADVWLGCSQSSMHSTRNTNHPDVGEKELAEALKIIIEHLEKNLYAQNGINLLDVIHDQEERKQFKLP